MEVETHWQVGETTSAGLLKSRTVLQPIRYVASEKLGGKLQCPIETCSISGIFLMNG